MKGEVSLSRTAWAKQPIPGHWRKRGRPIPIEPSGAESIRTSEIFDPSSSQAPGMRKTAIVPAGSTPSSIHALMTPRATMSTRVLETIDIITAIFSTPSFCSTCLARPQDFETEGLPPISA